MFKLLVTTILGLSIVGGTNVVPLQQAEVKNQNEIFIQAKEENFTTIQWHNNQYPISNDEASLSLFSEYAIEIDDAQTASDIYIQEEYIPFEEVVPAEYVNANADIAFLNGDYAYIQYKDVNGNWKTCIDLLACELPTDRTNPKYFEYDFIEGTYGIKFVAHKSNPTTNRNKGRICIGQTKFITCERN